jgi:PPE family protein
MTHPWPVFSPEVNYTTLARAGTGPASTAAYGEAFTSLAAVLESVVASSTVNAAGTYVSGVWQGAGAGAAAAHAGVNGDTMSLAAVAAAKAPIVASTAAAHPAAVSAMYPAEACVANRVTEAAHQAANPSVLGALTPAIAALDLQYFGSMWPTNAGSGAGFGALLRSAAVALAAPAMPAVSGAAWSRPRR